MERALDMDPADLPPVFLPPWDLRPPLDEDLRPPLDDDRRRLGKQIFSLFTELLRHLMNLPLLGPRDVRQTVLQFFPLRPPFEEDFRLLPPLDDDLRPPFFPPFFD